VGFPEAKIQPVIYGGIAREKIAIKICGSGSFMFDGVGGPSTVNLSRGENTIFNK